MVILKNGPTDNIREQCPKMENNILNTLLAKDKQIIGSCLYKTNLE
jgi:hypothetical protein